MVGRLEGIPFTLILTVVLSAIIIFAVLSFFEKYYLLIGKKSKIWKHIKTRYSKIKLFIWFVWFIVSTYYLLLYSPVITLVFLIGVYLFTKEFWTNIYSGILFLFEGKIKKGDYVYFPEWEMEGVVKNLMLLYVELVNQEEESIYIPFGKIMNTTFVVKEKVSDYYLNEFELVDEDYEKKLNKKDIENALLLCPWTVLSKKIEIDKTATGYKIKAVCFSREMAEAQKEFVVEGIR